MLLWTMTFLDGLFFHLRKSVEIKDCAKNGNNNNLETKKKKKCEYQILNGIVGGINNIMLVLLIIESYKLWS